MISSLYVCIKARKGIDSKWLIQILRSEHLVYYYNLYAEGGVRLYLFYPNFSRIRVTLPPLEQQSRIAAILGQIENKIKLESSILSGYRQRRKGWADQNRWLQSLAPSASGFPEYLSEHLA